MSDNSTRKAAIAAAIILAVVAMVFLAMPRIVIALGDISPWLGIGATLVFILAFFGIFWVRSRYQQRDRNSP